MHANDVCQKVHLIIDADAKLVCDKAEKESKLEIPNLGVDWNSSIQCIHTIFSAFSFQIDVCLR